MAIFDVISDATLVPIGVAVVCFVAVGSYTAWVSRKFGSTQSAVKDAKNDLSKEIAAQGFELRAQNQEIRTLIAECMQKDDFRRWERQVFRNNPSLKQPEESL
jgi:uncharacterized Ntn-hydrolase superfamily protein